MEFFNSVISFRPNPSRGERPMNSLKRSSVSFLALLCFAVSVFAQIDTPRPSPKASVTQRIGVTDVTITYSRPGVKGRKIWGDPLPEQAATKGEATLDN